MPNLPPVPLYEALQSYDHVNDNIPVIALIQQVALVNAQVDINTNTLNSAIGTQGTLANFLAQSLNQDGSLITQAVDNSLHHISEHLDGNGYVRMTSDQSAKLSFISPGATFTEIVVQTISGTVPFVNEVILLQPSDSITWRANNNMLFADANFPPSVFHQHYYGIIPIPQNLLTPDYKSYQTSSIPTAYMEGSLRVYINGTRLNETSNTYIPTGFPSVSYYSLTYSEDVAVNGIVSSGNFHLSQAITSTDVIIIDFDILIT